MPDAQERLRKRVRAALRHTGISQAEAARHLDVSAKHMSQMLTGRGTLTINWAERILSVCGMKLVIVVHYASPAGKPEEDARVLWDRVRATNGREPAS